MKNKKAKKTCSSTKKKTSNAKIAVTILFVFVLICGAVVGTIAAISDGFTKPVEEWFSDKATTVTPGDDQGDQTGDDQGDQTTPGGNDQGDQTGDEVVACEHVFEYGVCTKCGDRAADVLQMATKVVAPDEKCTINFYTADYHLIESKEVKGGDSIEFLEGYDTYAYLLPSEISIPDDASDVQDGSVLVGGKFYSLTAYAESQNQYLAIVYPTLSGGKVILTAVSKYIWGYKNGEFVSGSGFSETLQPGDELILLGGGFNSYVVDGFLYTLFKTNEGISFCSSLDVLNLIVPDYKITE